MASLSAPMAFEGWWLTFGHVGWAGICCWTFGWNDWHRGNSKSSWRKGLFGLRMSAHQSYIYVQLWWYIWSYYNGNFFAFNWKPTLRNVRIANLMLLWSLIAVILLFVFLLLLPIQTAKARWTGWSWDKTCCSPFELCGVQNCKLVKVKPLAWDLSFP